MNRISTLSSGLSRAWKEERCLCVMSLGFWVICGLTFNDQIVQPDGVGYYSYAQSLLIDHDLSLLNEFRGWGVVPIFSRLTPLGHVNNMFACGPSILWLPFLGVVHACLLTAKALGVPCTTDGFSPVYVGAINLATSFYGYLALVLAYRIASRLFPPSAASVGTTLIGALSPLFHYLFIHGTLPHALSAFTNALFLYLLSTARILDSGPAMRRYPSTWLRLGLCAGLQTIVRWQEVIVPLLVGFALGADALRVALSAASRTTRARPRLEQAPVCGALFYLGGTLLAVLPQLIVWQLAYGSPIATPQGVSFFRLGHPAILYVLFSSHHGLFSWTPILLPALFLGLPFLFRQQPRLGALALLAFLLQTFVNASVIDPAAGASYGSRRFGGLTVYFVLALTAVLVRLPRIATLFSILAALWTLPLWMAFQNRLVDQVGYLSFPDLFAAVARVATSLPEVLLQTIRGSASCGGASRGLCAALTLLVAIAIVAAFAIALSIPVRGKWRGSLRALYAFILITIVVDVLIGTAAARSKPAPVGVRLESRAAMLDFSCYANSKYDANPYNPAPYSIAAYQLPSKLSWHGVPFTILPPPREGISRPSNLTTCGLPLERFVIDLPAAPTRALHFALIGLGALEPGTPLLTIRIEGDSGTAEHTLLSGTDIWDYFVTPPVELTVSSHGGVGNISAYTFRLDGSIAPTRLVLTTPGTGAVLSPCVALLAVTQELASHTGEREPSHFVAIDLSTVANANYEQDIFRPGTMFNFFPDLRPGIMHTGSTPFLILDRSNVCSGETTITTSGTAPRSVRVPLVPQLSERISFLIDSNAHQPASLGEFRVEYETGPSTSSNVRAPADIGSYSGSEPRPHTAWQGAGRQALSLFHMELDQTRQPKYLWISRDQTPDPSTPGIAVFAITQWLTRSP